MRWRWLTDNSSCYASPAPGVELQVFPATLNARRRGPFAAHVALHNGMGDITTTHTVNGTFPLISDAKAAAQEEFRKLNVFARLLGTHRFELDDELYMQHADVHIERLDDGTVDISVGNWNAKYHFTITAQKRGQLKWTDRTEDFS